MTDTYKIEKFLFILTIAFCWSYNKIGEIKSSKIPIKIKPHKRKEISFFRLGYNIIRHTLYRVYMNFGDFFNHNRTAVRRMFMLFQINFCRVQRYKTSDYNLSLIHKINF